VINSVHIAKAYPDSGPCEYVFPRSDYVSVTVVVFVTLLLQVFIPYHRYVRFLKWLTLCLLAYAAVLFTVHVPWG
jgi:putative effector of murein hydrolase